MERQSQSALLENNLCQKVTSILEGETQGTGRNRNVCRKLSLEPPKAFSLSEVIAQEGALDGGGGVRPGMSHPLPSRERLWQQPEKEALQMGLSKGQGCTKAAEGRMPGRPLEPHPQVGRGRAPQGAEGGR